MNRLGVGSHSFVWLARHRSQIAERKLATTGKWHDRHILSIILPYTLSWDHLAIARYLAHAYCDPAIRCPGNMPQ